MTTPGSGNRWEPAAGTTPEDAAPLPDEHDPAQPREAAADEARPHDEPTASAGTGARRWPRWAARIPHPRPWLAVVAAVFLLLGGAAGFLVGHATAGGDTEVGRFGQLDQRGPGPGFGDGFGHDRTGPDGSGDDGFGPGDDGSSQ